MTTKTMISLFNYLQLKLLNGQRGSTCTHGYLWKYFLPKRAIDNKFMLYGKIFLKNVVSDYWFISRCPNATVLHELCMHTNTLSQGGALVLQIATILPAFDVWSSING